ncbi:MAG: 1-acyl-sn-glycerol-3-phosphate acyltransferase [Acidimicrobiia bacterium]
MRRVVDRCLGGIALLAVRGLFRSVEVADFQGRHLHRGRPVLVVANHFNGFVDPVLLAAALGRVPRFLAKATLWKVLPARPFLRLAGLIPVHRPEDHEGVHNESAFGAAVRVLSRGGVVAVFPEGTTHDVPRLARIRTGTARIALAAQAAGVHGVRILPVGITFEDKVALRSRALVRAGTSIDLDDERGTLVDPGTSADESNHEAVRRLTVEIEARLRDVSPDYDTYREEAALSRAAEVSLRTGAVRPLTTVALAPREALARRLGAAAPGERGRVADALARYQLSLDLSRVTDEEIEPPPGPRDLFGRLVRLVIGVVLLSPLAIAGILVNAIPALIVAVAGGAVRVPVTKGTVRLLVALIVFPATWVLAGVFDVGDHAVADVVALATLPLSPLMEGLFDGRAGVGPSVLVFVAAPVLGFAAVFLFELWTSLRRAWRAWVVVVNRRAGLAELRADRAALVGEVTAVAAVKVAR